MPLVELPSELLLCIVNYLGSQFFRRDIRRLTLFKRWYPLAWLVLASQLELTDPSLHKFVENESAYTRIQQHLGSVTLSLDQTNSLPTPSTTGRGYEAPPPRSIDIYSFYEARGRIELTRSLLNLADKLQRCPNLHTLRLLAPSLGPGHSPIQVQPLAALLLSTRYLTTLEVDLASTAPFRDRSMEPPHLCTSIHALLPTLRRLRCRMPHVCETLLDPDSATLSQGSGATAGPLTLLRLEELIVNLNLSETVPGLRAARCMVPEAYRFLSFDAAAFWQPLRLVMERRAVALAKRMARPRVVRVVSGGGSLPGWISFDALTLKRMRLEAGAAWDADGEVVGEGVEET